MHLFSLLPLLLVFHFKVRDQEFPYRRNLARVIVNVEDANDHSPYFTNPLYEASVFESAALGSAVLQVTALDKDRGENAELIYSIEAGKKGCTAVALAETLTHIAGCLQSICALLT